MALICTLIFISYCRKPTGPYFFSSSRVCSEEFAATKLVLVTCSCFCVSLRNGSLLPAQIPWDSTGGLSLFSTLESHIHALFPVFQPSVYPCEGFPSYPMALEFLKEPWVRDLVKFLWEIQADHSSCLLVHVVHLFKAFQ